MVKNRQSTPKIWSSFIVVGWLFYTICLWLITNSEQEIFADAIYLKNGSTIEGKIVSEDQKSVTIEMGFGTITINRSQIYEVIAEEWKPPTPKLPKISFPEKSITVTETVTSTNTTLFSDMYLVLDSKAQNPQQKDINKLLIKLIELPKEAEPWQIFDEMVTKSAKETDYLLLLLNEVKDGKVLKWVIEALGRHNVSRAIKPFFEILIREDESLKIAVLDALEQMKDVSTIHLIRGQLQKEKSPVVKVAFINHLFIAEDKESLPLLVDYLDDENSDVRKTSANAIINISQKATAEELIRFNLINSLKGKVVLAKHKETRQEIINIFGQLKSSEALETLMNFLLDENAEIRSEAAMALANIGDKKSTDFLIERLGKEQDVWTKMQIIGALQKINDATAIPVLIEALRDDEEKVRLCAARALRNITPYAFGEDYEKWKEWWEKEQKK